MDLKTAAFLAFVGMILLVIVTAVDFIHTLVGVLRDLIPAVMVIRTLIYLLASLSLAAFFFVFHRTQQR